MAKNKNKPIMDEPMAVIEEVEEEAVEKAEAPVAEEPKGEDFVMRTLKAINKMENPVKAERLANRLLRKRR